VTFTPNPLPNSRLIAELPAFWLFGGSWRWKETREVRFELAGCHTELGLFVSTSVLSFVKVSDRSSSFSTCTAHISAEQIPVIMDEKYIDDDTQLAQMGHKAELKRHFSLLYVYHFGHVGASPQG
jgi:hypothetical protein